MIKRKVALFVLLLLSFCVSAETIALRTPPESLTGQYVKDVLTAAYTSIGHTIEWQSVNDVNELDLVRKNKLTAALARTDFIKKEFPSLVQIPFPLLNFKLLKVSDRMRCGYCLNEDIRSITYAKNSLIAEEYANSLNSRVHKFSIANTIKLNQMLGKRRVDSVLLMDFQLDEKIAKNPHFIIETIGTHFDYHYLSPAYKHLKQPLLDAFYGLEQQGILASLRLKYGIHPEVKVALPQKHSLRFISGNWDGYTNADGSGVYWHLMDSIFKTNYTLNKDVSIWTRAIKVFEKNEADILVGAYRTCKINYAIYSSYHTDYEYPMYAFGQNMTAINRFNNKDKSLIICSASGENSFKEVSFLSKEDIIQTSVSQCNKLMENGKIDIFINYEYHLSELLKNSPRQLLIEYSPLFLVFHNTPEGHFLKRYFDKKIATLALNNTLKSIFPDEVKYKQAYIRP
jgi:hypothetical protein